MRLLWSLPKATPAILRHLVAYVELAVEDFERTNRDFRTRIFASLLLGVCLFFVIFTACLAVLAVTWDTPHRLSAIGWMGGVFCVLALIAGVYRSKVEAARSTFMGTVRREWAEDRVILDRILSDRD